MPLSQTLRITGDVFYVVEEGSFTIYDDDENELARVGKGSCFGELALLRQVGLPNLPVYTPSLERRAAQPAATGHEQQQFGIPH